MTSSTLGIVAIRADASVAIGTGHVMRCLTLAKELRHRSRSVSFYCRSLEDHLIRTLQDEGFPVHVLQASTPAPETGEREPYARWLGVSWKADAEEFLDQLHGGPVDWIIVDHYALDSRWEERMRSGTNHLLAIDDLADRPHDADILLDANWHPDLFARYQGLLGPATQALLGPRYALLRAEFRSTIDGRKPRQGAVEKVLVFLGGSDPLNLTTVVLQALHSLNHNGLSIDVIAGPINPHHAELQALAETFNNTRYHRQVSDMAEFIQNADLAIGGWTGGLGTGPSRTSLDCHPLGG